MQSLSTDEAELKAICAQAWELRDSGYLIDAVRSIEDWHDRRHLRALERREEHQAYLIRLLRFAADRVGRTGERRASRVWWNPWRCRWG
jgi:hypothetical protein